MIGHDGAEDANLPEWDAAVSVHSEFTNVVAMLQGVGVDTLTVDSD